VLLQFCCPSRAKRCCEQLDVQPTEHNEAGVGVGGAKRILGCAPKHGAIELSRNSLQNKLPAVMIISAIQQTSSNPGPAEQSLIVQLGVEAPGQQGPHLQGAISCCLLPVLEVVERVTALDPTGKLSAHHSLRYHLSGWLRLRFGSLLSNPVGATGPILAKPSQLPIFFQPGR
ncbi:hypothetical protein INR49_022325, partial [Caranx melampygus]